MTPCLRITFKGQKTFHFLNKLRYHEAVFFVSLILAQNSPTFPCGAHCHLILKRTLVSKVPIKGPVCHGCQRGSVAIPCDHSMMGPLLLAGISFPELQLPPERRFMFAAGWSQKHHQFLHNELYALACQAEGGRKRSVPKVISIGKLQSLLRLILPN